MHVLLPYKVLLWDFDGVLLNSNDVRDKGFKEVLTGFPQQQVAQLLYFHQANGGLSRYVKFRYFFEEIRKESISESEVNAWAAKFSIIMKKLLPNRNLLIQDSLEFVKHNAQTISMHIVSGSDQEELRYLCDALGIAHYFKTIQGSPTSKTELVAQLLASNGYKQDECALIGDSHNDFEAASRNQLAFIAYNNKKLEGLGTYIHQFQSL